MPTEDAVQVAASAITAEDFYAGQVPSRVKELLDDSCRREAVNPGGTRKASLSDTL
jgi:hypothetical protein